MEPDSQYTSDLASLHKYFHPNVIYTSETIKQKTLVYWDDQDVLKMGFVSIRNKERQFLGSQWKKRYVLIHSNFLIVFENNNEDKKPKAWMSFKKYDSIHGVEENASQKRKFQMVLASRRSECDKVYIEVGSSNEKEMWMTCLQAAMDFCQLKMITQRCKDFLVEKLFRDPSNCSAGGNGRYVPVLPPGRSSEGFNMFKLELTKLLTKDIVMGLAVSCGYPDTLTDYLENTQGNVAYQMVMELEKRAQITPTSIQPLEKALITLEMYGTAERVRSAFNRHSNSTQNSDSCQTYSDHAYAYPYDRDIYDDTSARGAYGPSATEITYDEPPRGACGPCTSAPSKDHTYDESPRSSSEEDLLRGRKSTKNHRSLPRGRQSTNNHRKNVASLHHDGVTNIRDTQEQTSGGASPNPVSSGTLKKAKLPVPVPRVFSPQSDYNRPKNIDIQGERPPPSNRPHTTP